MYKKSAKHSCHVPRPQTSYSFNSPAIAQKQPIYLYL